jgi:hypothetical protein
MEDGPVRLVADEATGVLVQYAKKGFVVDAPRQAVADSAIEALAREAKGLPKTRKT